MHPELYTRGAAGDQLSEIETRRISLLTLGGTNFGASKGFLCREGLHTWTQSSRTPSPGRSVMSLVFVRVTSGSKK
jgi:hypothetical protein